jgi:stage V sporulation protein D (sporulation-specific penicillin-binding protein)
MVQGRFLWLLIGFTCYFLLMLMRLAYVQLVQGPILTAKAEDVWRRNVPFPAQRGEIQDRNGVQIAYNVSRPTVWAIPAQIKDVQATASQLSRFLHMPQSTLTALLKQRSMLVRLQPGGRQIDPALAQKIEASNMPGIKIAEDYKRYYPYGRLASHLLGFVGIDNQGLTGLELANDKYLTGVSGGVAFFTDASGRSMPNLGEQYQKPRPGMNLQLTIDQHIQTILERELDRTMIQFRPNQALGIVMNPKTGEILAMAAKPDYNPSQYRKVPSAIYNRNLPVWMTYEPGSTFKIITLASALNEKVVNLDKDRFYDPGYIKVANARLRCWKRTGHGSQTFLEGVENSCNPGFVLLGQRLGKKKLFSYIRNFGFGQKTGVDLTGEENGILFRLNRVGPVELATTAFGQGVSVTPIQQIAAVSAAINGGYLMRPYVTKALVNPQTNQVVRKAEPHLVRRVISAQASKEVRRALESVVANGTGRNAFIDGYRVGGKTGTAQKVIQGRYSNKEYIVSFVGFAPADDPKLIMYVAVDNPKGIQFGGLIAAPIVKNVMEDSLQWLHVPRRKNQMPKKTTVLDTPIVTVPNLIGQTTQEIYESLQSNFRLAKIGTGSVVIQQAPRAGSRIPRGSTIRLFMANPVKEGATP